MSPVFHVESAILGRHRRGNGRLLRSSSRGIASWSAWVVLVLGVLLVAVGAYLVLVGGGILVFASTMFVGLGLALVVTGFTADFVAERRIYKITKR